jgi:hypothetical protein
MLRYAARFQRKFQNKIQIFFFNLKKKIEKN